MSESTFDPSIFEQYYLRPEEVPGLDLTDGTSRACDLLQKVRGLTQAGPPLLKRHFQPVTAAGTSSPSKGGFRVMQWNCLAQGLCKGNDNFVRCPVDALVWETRRLRLLEEILTVSPDVLCLQEVDHFGFLSPALESVGYASTFFPKPDSPALYTRDTNGPDGCALFYRKEHFDAVAKESVVLKDAQMTRTNQVTVIHVLELKAAPRSKFCVATTHLKAKDGWSALRHQQGSYLLKYLDQNYSGIPTVICGDFNADKTERVYRAFVDSSLKLSSAYTKLSASGEDEPPYTTWKIRGMRDGPQQEVCRTIDYIWHSKDTLQVETLYAFPTGDEIGDSRLPSLTYPSDHFSLAADLQFL